MRCVRAGSVIGDGGVNMVSSKYYVGGAWKEELVDEDVLMDRECGRSALLGYICGSRSAPVCMDAQYCHICV